jgi:energy-coupling factor transporter ATP-binding protein EcfA2
MPVTKLTLERFGPFGDAEFDLSPGVNVVLGANSTGKTFALKALYSVLKGLGPEARPGVTPRELLRDKLAAVFVPDDGDVRRLVSRVHGKTNGRIRVELDDLKPVRATISTGGKQVISSLSYPRTPANDQGPPRARLDIPALFLPSREVLAMYEGFVAAYQQRELSFDETYFDTAVALSAGALRGPRPGELRDVVEKLEKELGGKVRLEGPRFYLRSKNRGKLEAHLMAEGLRKIASIVHLIANGALRQGGILIWDEPEANLHPRLAEVVVECLGALAEAGVQILVATHDYLIADAVSRWSEYRTVVERTADVRFFQLRRDVDDEVRVDQADTFIDLPRNPLLDAFLDHHDEEQRLIARRLTITDGRGS